MIAHHEGYGCEELVSFGSVDSADFGLYRQSSGEIDQDAWLVLARESDRRVDVLMGVPDVLLNFGLDLDSNDGPLYD
jgi:hypothetical protein